MASGLFNLKQQLQGLIQGAWTTPQPTYYGSFNGSNQVLTASATSLNIRTNSFTLEGFYYANNFNANYALWGGVSASTFYIQYNNAGRIFVSDGVTDTLNPIFTSVWFPQIWTHIAVTFDGTTYRIFFNGVLLQSSTTLLDWILRRAGVNTVVVCGIVTNGGVASTVRDAHMRDYQTVVLGDGCATFTETAHQAALTDMSSVAQVMTCNQFLATL